MATRCGTGKVTYFSRREARKARSRIVGMGRSDSRLRDYRCSGCGLFHLGHHPGALIRGEITRAVL